MAGYSEADMEFTYIAYSKDRKLVKGRLSAADDKSASGLLDTGGFQVVQIKPVSKSIDWKGLNARFAKVDKRELVMFSRQLALLIESGIGVIRGLEIIQLQTANPAFKTIIGEVIADLQDGKTLAAAMARHPKMFSQMYHRTISAGEQAGNLDEVLPPDGRLYRTFR